MDSKELMDRLATCMLEVHRQVKVYEDRLKNNKLKDPPVTKKPLNI